MAKIKPVKIKNINSIRKYLQIFSGVFGLTSKEIDVLSEIIRYQFLARINKQQDTNPFSAEAKKQICERMNIANPYSINTYLARLRKRKAIIRTQEGGQQVHPWLMPMGEKQIIIDLEWKLKL